MKSVLCVSLLVTAGSIQAMNLNRKNDFDKIRPAATPSQIKATCERLLNGKTGFERIRMAITLSQTEEVIRLLNEEKQSSNLIDYKRNINEMVSNETLLYIAASNGDLEIVALLIDEGANVNVGNNHNCTPLHAAVSSNNPDVVALLLKKKANPNACNNNNNTPLHYAVREFFQEIGTNSEIIRILLKNGANATIIAKSPYCNLIEYCDSSKGLGEYEKSEQLRALFNAFPHCKRRMNTNNQ